MAKVTHLYIPVVVGVPRTPNSQKCKTARTSRYEESIALEKYISNILMLDIVYKRQ